MDTYKETNVELFLNEMRSFLTQDDDVQNSVKEAERLLKRLVELKWGLRVDTDVPLAAFQNLNVDPSSPGALVE